MMDAIGVILAAGRGSRMQTLTQSRPKCLLSLAGRPLLLWQMDALRAAGVRRILVVRGYLAHMLTPRTPDLATADFEPVENPRWDKTNMVQTLLCAFPALAGNDAVISYSDIVYHPSHVTALSRAQGEICITYDSKWEALWRLRNDDPLEDAETFKEHGGRLLEIGARPKSLASVQGQYMGLLKLTSLGRGQIKAYTAALSADEADKLDMTTLLRGLLQQGVPVTAVPVAGKWCECDTPEDIRRYERRRAEGPWEHDWSAGW